MTVIRSVIMIFPDGVKHCDLILEENVIKFKLVGERRYGRSRRGLPKGVDLLLYRLEKEKRIKENKIVLQLTSEDIKCWRVEKHSKKGVAKEYLNTFVFSLRLKNGKEYKMLVSNKVFQLFKDTVIKFLKRAEVEEC